jgi:hypothetical protein
MSIQKTEYDEMIKQNQFIKLLSNDLSRMLNERQADMGSIQVHSSIKNTLGNLQMLIKMSQNN